MSSSTATSLLRDLINSDTYFLSDSKVYETVDSLAFVRGARSVSDRYDSDLSLTASVNTEGQLLVKGTVGKTFKSSAEYISSYDSNSYFPEQLDSMVVAKAKSMFPSKEYAALSEEEKNKVWESVKEESSVGISPFSKQPRLQVRKLKFLWLSLWKRLYIFQLGDVVEYNGKLWESTKNENFNHEPSFAGSEFGYELAMIISSLGKIGRSRVLEPKQDFISLDQMEDYLVIELMQLITLSIFSPIPLVFTQIRINF